MYDTLHASCFKNPGFIVRSHSLIYNREARELRLRQIKLSHFLANRRWDSKVLLWTNCAIKAPIVAASSAGPR